MILGAILLVALAAGPGWEVHFSPHGGCTASIVAAIDSAAAHQDTILVQAYNFTSAPIGQALQEARKAGSVVRIIVDANASHQKNCQAQACKAAGCEVYVDAKHQIAHNKVIIAGPRVVGGSFNYSNNAEEHNAENCPISPPGWELREAYVQNWMDHLAHSVALP
jgi:phosphatidylserine/phosphatidylglycerophosphate/cardiolipin synthase-like enzyme